MGKEFKKYYTHLDIERLLPDDILDLIASLENTLGKQTSDQYSWVVESNEQFSVKSAYHLLMQNEWDEKDSTWNLIWKWPGPQRIRVFLWLIMINNKLTKKEFVATCSQ